MIKPEKPTPAEAPPTAAKPDPRPAYEAPRILKKRSVARVTLASNFGGTGPSGGGFTGGG